MVEYRHHAAKVRCKIIGASLQAQYTGPMSLSTCLHLGSLVRRCAGHRNTVECVCKSLTMVGSGLNPDVSYLIGSPPGCYVVRPDQYDLMMEFSAILAGLGVIRLVFHESEQLLAKGWISAFGSQSK